MPDKFVMFVVLLAVVSVWMIAQDLLAYLRERPVRDSAPKSALFLWVSILFVAAFGFMMVMRYFEHGPSVTLH